MEALTGTLARQASVRVSGHVKSVNFAAVPRASASGRPSARLNIVARSSDPVGRKKSTRAPSPTQVAAVDAPPTATAPSIDLSQEYEAAATAVRLASKLCDAVQSQLKSAEKMEKDDSSPVTVADYGAQALVAWSLQRTLPHQKLSMIAEEDSVDLKASEGAAMLRRITDLVNETLAGEPDAPAVLTSDEVIALIDQGNSEGGPTGRHWVLDPIDGTRGFVSMRQYAVCLGLLVDGEVLLGVLGAPNLPHWAIADVDCNENYGELCKAYDDSDGVGTIFAAQKGCGAFAGPLFDMDGLPDHRIHCDDSLAPEEVRYMESFEKKHSNHKLAFAISEEVGIELPSLRIDSQAKYGALSRGDASIFMRFPPEDYREKIWDHAAGAIIVTEAGACISDAMGNPLDFSQGRFFPYLNGGIIAATPSMHRAILAALRKFREEGTKIEHVH
ncbi:hypothetical protein Ndes2526B_g06157 [Nannochloris sp. 'desiccata']|nr:putative SAL1 phosphatase [Chlorella desiccata (nom. nud.)]